MDLLINQPENRRHYSNAELIGFTDSNGFRCENSETCGAFYCTSPGGTIEVLVGKARYEPLKDGDSDYIWEIVDSWTMFIDTEAGKRVLEDVQIERDFKRYGTMVDDCWDFQDLDDYDPL
ncbi:MAG: hypothetical protein WC813_00685 [Patescibacteria group bacterium]